MRRLGLLVLLAACDQPQPPSGGFSGPGETCGLTQQCAQGLDCRGGLCLGPNSDVGVVPDAGNNPPDSGIHRDAGRPPPVDAGLARQISVAIVQPDRGTSIEQGSEISAVAELSGDDFDDVRLRWSSDLDGEIGVDNVSPTGRVLRSIALQASGIHRLRVEVLEGADVIAARLIDQPTQTEPLLIALPPCEICPYSWLPVGPWSPGVVAELCLPR